MEGSRVVLGGVGRLMLSWRMIHIFVSRAAATACTAPVQLDISSNREVHARRPVLLRALNASDEPAGATHDSDVLAAAVPQARPRAFGSALGSSSAQVRHSRPSGPRPAARAMTSAAAMLITQRSLVVHKAVKPFYDSDGSSRTDRPDESPRADDLPSETAARRGRSRRAGPRASRPAQPGMLSDAAVRQGGRGPSDRPTCLGGAHPKPRGGFRQPGSRPPAQLRARLEAHAPAMGFPSRLHFPCRLRPPRPAAKLAGPPADGRRLRTTQAALARAVAWRRPPPFGGSGGPEACTAWGAQVDRLRARGQPRRR